MKKRMEKQMVWMLTAFLLIIFIVVNFIAPKQIRTSFIDGDGSGLYAYLPAVFVYNTVNFQPVFEFEKSRRPPGYLGHNYHKINKVTINKFSCGTALMELPFFFVAWLLSIFLGFPVDGYNVLFQYGVACANLFWVIVGLVYLVRLEELYHIQKPKAWLMALAGFFGTNLLFYTFVNPSASHTFSFSLVAMFLYYSKKLFLHYERKPLLAAAFLLGMITLVRPVDFIIILALPFLASNPQNLFHIIRKKVIEKDVIPAVVLFLVALSPQLLINYLQTGQLLVYGYKNEGFYFSHPQIINFLFGFRKGWFVYTPFMLLLFPALIALWKRSKFEMISFLAFLIVVIYLFSAWWNWLYGDSFGMRPMVDFYALFFLVIAIFYQEVGKKILQVLIMVFIGFVIFINLIQTYQYATGILHPDSMNKSAYWYIFLKTDDQYRHVVGDEDEYFYGKLSDHPFFETRFQEDSVKPGWSLPGHLETLPGEKEKVVKLEATTVYSPSYTYVIPREMVGSDTLYAFLDAVYLEPGPNASSGALFVADVSDSAGKTVFYKAFHIKRLPDKKTGIWRDGSIGFKLPRITPGMEKIKFYIWNRDKHTFYLKSIRLRLFKYSR